MCHEKKPLTMYITYQTYYYITVLDHTWYLQEIKLGTESIVWG